MYHSYLKKIQQSPSTIAAFVLVLVCIVSCSGSSGEVTNDIVSPPDQVELLRPTSNQIFINEPPNGTVTLTFEWSKNKNTDTYTLRIFNLSTLVEQTLEALTTTITSIALDTESEYSWSVTAKNMEFATTSVTRYFSITNKTNSPSGWSVDTEEKIRSALQSAAAGDTIYIKAGEYHFDSTIRITNHGDSKNKIVVLPYGEGTERPKFIFSAMGESSSNRGILLNADYWHIKGIDLVGAGDNGMFIAGSHNLIEFCTFSENRDTGLQLGSGASSNTILNCDSFYNADSSLENADGFACKIDAGDQNRFIGCRAWQNLDDGWDGYLRNTNNITTIYQNCWAFKNGYLKNGTAGTGDGNGFKTGGSDAKDLSHHAVFTNCLAIGNLQDGFDHNSNRGNVTLYNCSAFDNNRNYSFSNTNALARLTLINCNVLGAVGSTNAMEQIINSNSWQLATVTEADFLSLDYNQLAGSRKADGSLPTVTFFHLAPHSDMIDAGQDVGLPFNGSAPDLGAFENE